MTLKSIQEELEEGMDTIWSTMMPKGILKFKIWQNFKQSITKFLLSKFSLLLEELQREINKLDHTLNHVYREEVIDLIKNITK